MCIATSIAPSQNIKSDHFNEFFAENPDELPLRVKGLKRQIEHIFSGLASIADLAQRMTAEPEGNDLL
jgi:hypothetical protein